MRSPIRTAIFAIMLAGLAGPGQAAEGEGGGVAKTCQSAADGEAKQFFEDVTEMTREQLLPNLQAYLGPAFEAFLGLSDREQDEILQQFQSAMVELPAVMQSFCDHFARGAVPGIGDGAGHGSLALDWGFKFGKDSKTVAADDEEPGAGDCERPYSVTIEFDAGGTTKHIFCEAAAGFELSSSYRPDGADGWTRIE